MKLSEIKGEAALDVLADLFEPAAEIVSDKEIADLYKSEQLLKAVKVALKKHKKAVIQILAITEGEDPETYEPNVLSLPAKLIEIFNDPELMGLFHSQGQTEETSSGSAMETIEAKGR